MSNPYEKVIIKLSDAIGSLNSNARYRYEGEMVETYLLYNG